jgi:2-polyprenyl-6-methoxyphenol hydroxylase-like FAD-dependent oxidoreductase
VRIVIVGAGIGGLTTALALHHVGLRNVQVLESVQEIRPLGVGINLLPHAVRELTALGLADDLDALGVETADLAYHDTFGSLIWREPRGTAAGYRWPQYSILRGELQMLLLDKVRERLGPGAVRTGARVRSAGTTADGTHVYWDDQSGPQSVTADVVVAADGIRSTIRSLRHPHEGPPAWNGMVLWRGTSRIEPFLTGRSMIMAGSADVKFVCYPVQMPGPDGLQRINWIAERRSDSGDVGDQDWNRQVTHAHFAHHFATWTFPWLDVPAVIASAEAVYEYPMVDRPPLTSWVEGRVALLGDAAHPTYPIGSNGSSQAIIDARVLAHALATRSIDDALAFYESERLPRTTELQRVNREMGPERVMRLVHERAPGGFSDIETVIPWRERQAIADDYKRVAGFLPEALNAAPSWDLPG